MKFSSKVQKCGLSPMRKFHPYAVAAEAKGRNIYHLNIGQPDIETPKAFFEAIRDYYAALDMHFAAEDILITNGGSEALQIAMNCILDDGDEILIPEPFYPNYNTMARTCGAVIHPVSTSPEEGYFYADRRRIEAEITPRTRAILVTNPGNPTGTVLTHEEMEMLVDVARQHDLFLIGDEAYREFVYAGEPLRLRRPHRLPHLPQPGAHGPRHEVCSVPSGGADAGPVGLRRIVSGGAGVFRRCP